MKTLIKIAVPSIIFLILCNILLCIVLIVGEGSISTSLISVKPDNDISDYSLIQLVVWLIPSFVFIYSLYRLLQLFILFSKGDFFAVTAIQHLKWFSGFYMLSTLLSIIVNGVLDSWTSKPEGSELTLNLNIQSGEIGEFGMALIFFVVAFILNEARQNKEALERIF